jgi:hypothetical protein
LEDEVMTWALGWIGKLVERIKAISSKNHGPGEKILHKNQKGQIQ